ncbi:MAG: hypothetical protein ABSH32_24145 [Bryobacteraceae bacterium]
MCKTSKTIFLLSGALLMAVAPARVKAQNFDTSGTASLTGQYLFRYVDYFNDDEGDVTESCSLTGVITFDGAGNYTLSNTQLFDSAGTTGGGSCSSLGGGTYGVQSNGIAQLDNPLFGAIPGTLFGTFSQPVITASSTEDDYFDLFIAVQAPLTSASNSLLSGTFTVGTLDFLEATATLARQGYFNISADGNGNIAAFTVNGSAANLNSGNSLTQTVAASTYALSGTTGGTLTLPSTYGDTSQIVAGQKVLYVSADGNWFVGGSTAGSDMVFGFRASSGTSSNATLTGTYFMAGLEDYIGQTPNFLDAFWGSTNTNGNGDLLWHERFDDVVDVATYDLTINTPVDIGADGSYYDGNTYTYLTGANGNALMLIGSNLQFSLIVGVHAPAFPQTSTVWINPIGITNAGNYAPITNATSPGELVNLFGNFGVPLQLNKVLPVPTNLGGVQVFVNGRAAPVYLVSPTQIVVLVPYETAGDYFDTFQVQVNNSKSNTVTVYADLTSPGIFTQTENGVGPGAILHQPPNYTEVTDSNPAKPGETVQLFMNGLGTVTPQVADGAPGPSVAPFSTSDESADILVELVDQVGDQAQATVTFAGLAPGFAGLYQVNFTLPTSGLANGDVYIAFNTDEALTEMATIALTGFPDVAAQTRPVRGAARLRRRVVASGATHARNVKDHRRALPERSKVKP